MRGLPIGPPAGACFYQDPHHRTVIGTPDREVWVLPHTDSCFTVEQKYELTGAIPKGDEIEALQRAAVAHAAALAARRRPPRSPLAERPGHPAGAA